MVRIGVLVILLLGSGGMANAQVSTTCTRYGNTVQCNSGNGIDPTIPLRIQPFDIRPILEANRANQDRVEQQRSAELAADQARSDAQAQQARQHLSQVVHEGVGEYLRDGKCREAIAFALQYGEITLASQAKDFCAKPTP